MAVANTSGKAATLLVSGVVGIGMITALFAPGRTTVQGFTAGGKAASGLLGTAING
jgi:hypothetical protein